MLKRVVLFLITLGLILPSINMMAQDDCVEFASGSTNERTSYYLGEGAAFMRSGNYASAIHAYTCIIDEIDESNGAAFHNRAMAFAARREYEHALEDYTQAIALRSDNVGSYNNRGVVYASVGEYEDALDDFSSALSEDSDYVNAIINRGIISAIQGDYDAAEADFRQVIENENLDAVIAELQDPERDPEAPAPEFNLAAVNSYALLGIVQSQRAAEVLNDYLFLAGGRADGRVQSAAGALESRFEFELRLDDGSWFLLAGLAGS